MEATVVKQEGAAAPAEPAPAPAPVAVKREADTDTADEAKPRKRRRKKRAWDAADMGDDAAIVVPAQVVLASLPPLTPQQSAQLHGARHYALQQSVLYRSKLQQGQGAMNNAAASASMIEKAATVRGINLMSRVYVGSIYYEVGPDDVRKLFEPFGYIKEVNMTIDPDTKRHKGFAFVEYECPEAVALALSQCEGAQLCGRSIKIGRPTNAATCSDVTDKLAAEARKLNSVYVSSINPKITEADVREMFEAFGKIDSCRLCPDPEAPSNHRGFGYVNYTADENVDEAVAAMNMMDVGERFLRVSRAVLPPEEYPGLFAVTAMAPSAGPTASAAADSTSSAAGTAAGSAAAAPSASVAKPAGVGSAKDLDEENAQVSGSTQRYLIMKKLAARSVEENVVILRNMVTVSQVDEFLEEEVKEECLAHGKVQQVVVHKESAPDDVFDVAIACVRRCRAEFNRKLGSDISTEVAMYLKAALKRHPDLVSSLREHEWNGRGFDVSLSQSQLQALDDALLEAQKAAPPAPTVDPPVKIFVEFEAQQGAAKAVEALNGRYFGGKVVIAELYDTDRFEQQDYAG